MQYELILAENSEYSDHIHLRNNHENAAWAMGLPSLEQPTWPSPSPQEWWIRLEGRSRCRTLPSRLVHWPQPRERAQGTMEARASREA